MGRQATKPLKLRANDPCTLPLEIYPDNPRRVLIDNNKVSLAEAIRQGRPYVRALVRFAHCMSDSGSPG